MNIESYTFEEFKNKAAAFHGYPAPGLLIGGYMVARAKSMLPEGTLFDAVCETSKCLPDAVQLLSLCSIGNGWMKIVNLGRYAVTLYDKYTGQGVRVWIDTDKLEQWPEIKCWLLKLKPKKEQDSDKLFEEIEQAGHNLCSWAEVQVSERFMKHASMGSIGICPACSEPYPTRDGAVCRGCQGEAPYVLAGVESAEGPSLRLLRTEEAVGEKALHDMTRIVPGESKDAEFTAGQELSVGDVCRLHQMGRSRVYVQGEEPGDEWVHENDAVRAFAGRMAGEGVRHEEEPHEGKINFMAGRDGLLVIDRERLAAFNLLPDVMCATRQGDIFVEKGKPFAGSRAIPLYLSREHFSRALAVLGDQPLFEVLEIPARRVGILVTGTEVFKGLIKDRFAPIISGKVEKFGCSVVGVKVAPDDQEAIRAAVKELVEAGAELIVTTAGLSVDPDDVTRAGLLDAGLVDAHYGMPVLPGTMTLVGRIGNVRVIGVPACALFFKTTSFDLLLPRLLAGQEIGPREMARYGEGGFCLNCRACTYPKCPFGK